MTTTDDRYVRIRDGWRRFCDDFDVSLAVLSRDRAGVLANNTDRLASEYQLFYCGDGYDDYEYRCTERHEVPRGVEGRGAAGNFALRALGTRFVILIPDDLRWVNWLSEDRLVHLDSAGFLVMLINLVVNARDVGAGLFGISENDIRKNSPLAPFHTRSMITCIVGLDRSHPKPIWYDERQKLKEDYDFTLQHIKRDRLIWKDLRYFAFHDMNVLPGGNMAWRTPAREEAEVENLRRWWGDDVIRWSPAGRNRGQRTKHLGINI